MAEIMKVTQPMIPKENMGTKFRPESDQAIAINDPTKINRRQENNAVGDKKAEQNIREHISRNAILPALRPASDMTQALRKLLFFVEMGISSSNVMLDGEIKDLLETLFVSPEELLGALTEQEQASVVFKGESFDLIRDVLGKFPNNPRVKDSIVNLLKTFEYNVNVDKSLKSILQNCDNILDYMFTADREQFSHYLAGLKALLLPAGEQAEEAAAVNGEPEATTAADGEPEAATAATVADGREIGGAAGENNPLARGATAREAAHLLKNNLVPLLGEVVGKYHQAQKIRDIVMVVVHNVVRVDKGTPEALKEAVANLASELKKVANLPPNFEQRLLDSIRADEQKVRQLPDVATDKMTKAIASAFEDGDKIATVRQAENLLISMLQNQNPIMDILHFVLPMRMGDDRSVAEMYVDPNNDERESRSGSNARKIFLSAESEEHGSFELCFWAFDKRVDFSLWCPGILVDSLSKLRGTFSDLMQREGFTMGNFEVAEFVEPHTVADVFPKLVTKRTGIDVRI